MTALATPSSPVSASIAEASRFVLHDVSWEVYEALLAAVGEGHVRITYDNGSLELMSPLPRHEFYKILIGQFVDILSNDLDIPMTCAGSATFKRRDLQKGLEPDQCYYIQNEESVRGKMDIDLLNDPPPDLAVEVDITHRSIEREKIYAALGVPELWRFNGVNLTVRLLGKDKQYQTSKSSAAFPNLPMGEFERFLKMFETSDQTTVRRAFRDWVKKKLA